MGVSCFCGLLFGNVLDNIFSDNFIISVSEEEARTSLNYKYFVDFAKTTNKLLILRVIFFEFVLLKYILIHLTEIQ